MALNLRLDVRQSQSLVMTPQLQQAIRLLAASNLEIESYISDALDTNPLLEMGEVRRDSGEDRGDSPDAPATPVEAEPSADRGPATGDAPLDLAPDTLDHDRETGDGSWGARLAGGAPDGDHPSIEDSAASGASLVDHLHAQVGAVARDAQLAFLARDLIDRLDEAGYLTQDLGEIAATLGAAMPDMERALAVVQTLEPTGVGARGLAECLALQAREADRYDPCMARLIGNLDLVAKGDIARLKRLCDVDDEDLADMLAELRAYDPRPGLALGAPAPGAVVPDILLAPAHRGDGWSVVLNPDTLPRLIVNRQYALELGSRCRDQSSRAWLKEKLADARWLIRALDQRQKTILAVAARIVEEQAGFFRHGVSRLKPLTLRQIAEAIDMHESTVSRVTANKYLHCPRGTFELKYFFTSGVGSADGDGASSEAVKARIKALTDAEEPKAILSDDKLVSLLKAEGFDIARRTVAKYREAMGIGSSVERRRRKKLRGL